MILHLINDEKFIDMAFRLFEEVYPNQNEFILFSDYNNLNLGKDSFFKVVEPTKLNYKTFVSTFKKYDAIIFHGLDAYKLELLNIIPKNTVIVWIGFGYDYYDLIVQSKTDLLDKRTKKLFSAHQIKEPFSEKIKEVGQRIIKVDRFMIIRTLKKVKRLIFGFKEKRELINSIIFFAPVLNEEYLMVKDSSNYHFKPLFLDWNYGTLEDDFIRGYENIKLQSNNVLVGNSASYENNHLDAFEKLTHLELKDRKIITPLSYGDSLYREDIVNEGEKRFKDNFMPLVGFMPIDEYIKIISTCSIVIMNHIRQQALGNIITMMYLGAIIILKRENPIYKFFKNEGAIIFSFDDFETSPDLIDSQLTLEEIKTNQAVLKKHWSRNRMQYKTKELIDAILRIK